MSNDPSPTKPPAGGSDQRLVRLLEWAERERESHFEDWLHKPCSEKHKTIYLAHSEAMREVAAKIRSLMANDSVEQHCSD
jgi:hypothetical protein